MAHHAHAARVYVRLVWRGCAWDSPAATVAIAVVAMEPIAVPRERLRFPWLFAFAHG
jgi:hypothetical protein